MKQLYIDFDGVILDTMTKSYEELKREKIDFNILNSMKNDYKILLVQTMLFLVSIYHSKHNHSFLQ